jgi:hypothetical protein
MSSRIAPGGDRGRAQQMRCPSIRPRQTALLQATIKRPILAAVTPEIARMRSAPAVPLWHSRSGRSPGARQGCAGRAEQRYPAHRPGGKPYRPSSPAVPRRRAAAMVHVHAIHEMPSMRGSSIITASLSPRIGASPRTAIRRGGILQRRQSRHR